MNILTKKATKSLLDRVVASSGAFNDVYCGLYVTGDPLTEDSFLSASPSDGGLEEPSLMSGYARQAVTWSSSYNDPAGGYKINGNALHFAGDTAHPYSIAGYFIASASSAGSLVSAEEFQDPVQLTETLDGVGVVPELKIPASADYGSGVQI